MKKSQNIMKMIVDEDSAKCKSESIKNFKILTYFVCL